MTKQEFMCSLPNIINHRAWGYGELEIISDDKHEKSACYRHKDNTASGGNHADSWEALYRKIRTYLEEEGYI